MVILIEFNELTPALLAAFMSRGALPNFQRFYSESTVFNTYVTDEALDPWVQWPTIHSGVPYSEHGIAHMGDGGLNLQYRCIAQVLADAGIRSGIFGSMNLNYEDLPGYMIPDPWDKRGRAYPRYLQPFYDIVSAQVKDSSRYLTQKRQVAKMGMFMLKNGLTPPTAFRIVRQLLNERADSGVRWRRAMLLDHIGYDLFKTLNRRHGVEFATFFSNSTAHFQHFYWREMAPHHFSTQHAPAHPSLPFAILAGYRSMDTIIGRLVNDYPHATLVFCTALSQGPRTVEDLYYVRIGDHAQFLRFLEISSNEHPVLQCMASEFHIRCPDEPDARSCAARVAACTVNGAPAFNVALEDRKVVVAPRGSTDAGILDRTLMAGGGKCIRYGAFAHLLEGLPSGTHRREGALWIRSGRHAVVANPIELTDIAPTILQMFGVPRPAHMRGRALPLAV